MKKGFIIAGIAVVVGIIIFFNVRGRKGAVTEVRVQPVTSMNLVEKVNTTGEVKPKKFVNISSDVTGRIMKITVKEGDYVKKDQLLIKIDSEFSEWEAQRAKACERSRTNLEGLESGQIRFRMGANGEREALDGAVRDAELNEARRIVDANCSPRPAAAAKSGK